ncbi:hypothetical protein HAX54_002670 [Datura stramonium]|uniref:Uncharacterized protein n=1 Tax=Datura stramonium TaxID=4076 RepID=A0ABS8WU57_DATST|nr:hypothetical protein [Datura stramonium]
MTTFYDRFVFISIEDLTDRLLLESWNLSGRGSNVRASRAGGTIVLSRDYSSDDFDNQGSFEDEITLSRRRIRMNIPFALFDELKQLFFKADLVALDDSCKLTPFTLTGMSFDAARVHPRSSASPMSKLTP